jgi:hypothetical protein
MSDGIDTSVAHVARVYNYWLGGTVNYPADRAAGDQAIAAYPGMVASVRANRAFQGRTVRVLAADRGIRQFLDLGTGIPAADNTHEVAQAADPSARVVYVDNDPVVLAHSRDLLASHPAGATAYLDCDLRDTGTILAQAARTLDLRQPVAVLMIAVLQLIGDGDDPYGIVAAVLDAVPPGSYLALSHLASDIAAAPMADAVGRVNRLMAQHVTPRNRAQVTRFFDGLELTSPVSCRCRSGGRARATRAARRSCGAGSRVKARGAQKGQRAGRETADGRAGRCQRPLMISLMTFALAAAGEASRHSRSITAR